MPVKKGKRWLVRFPSLGRERKKNDEGYSSDEKGSGQGPAIQKKKKTSGNGENDQEKKKSVEVAIREEGFENR